MVAFPPGCCVRHIDWGDGTVLRVDGEHLVVLFDSVGVKTLVLRVVLDCGFLTRLR